MEINVARILCLVQNSAEVLSISTTSGSTGRHDGRGDSRQMNDPSEDHLYCVSTAELARSTQNSAVEKGSPLSSASC